MMLEHGIKNARYVNEVGHLLLYFLKENVCDWTQIVEGFGTLFHVFIVYLLRSIQIIGQIRLDSITFDEAGAVKSYLTDNRG